MRHCCNLIIAAQNKQQQQQKRGVRCRAPTVFCVCIRMLLNHRDHFFDDVLACFIIPAAHETLCCVAPRSASRNGRYFNLSLSIYN